MTTLELDRIAEDFIRSHGAVPGFLGYNGFPKGCSDDEFPWGKTSENPLENKYLYTTHSELNAILNYRGGSLEGAKLYVTLFPCNECCKAIIQAGIKTVIYDCKRQWRPCRSRKW